MPVLDGTKIRVSEIVVYYEYFNKSPEEIIQEFPSLTIADIHSALTYYYENPNKIREEIAKREEISRKIKDGGYSV